MHFIIEFSNGIVQLSSVYNICAIKSMIVLEMKCPQLSKPEVTAATCVSLSIETVHKEGSRYLYIYIYISMEHTKLQPRNWLTSTLLGKAIFLCRLGIGAFTSN